MINKEQLFQAAQCILFDIEAILHYNSPGEFYLPEDTGGELTYQFFGQDLVVEFDWQEMDSFETNLVLGDYYNNEATIKISLINSKNIDCDTISNIGEVIAHELTHWLQELNGVVFPFADNIEDDSYYLQNHEIEAQYYGFEFQCKYLNLSLEQAIDLWFEKYGEFHSFKDPHNFKKKLLSHLEKFAQEELHF